MLNRAAFLLVFWVLFLAGCGSEPERAPAVDEAFVGPATLSLRQELAPRAPMIATVKHGERLEILGHRRRFVRVRTEQGAEGWVDSRQLLSSGQMAELEQLSVRTAKLPSQGKATVYEFLNVHTVANRHAPSFSQIHKGEKVDVIQHQLAPRVAYEPPSDEPPPSPEDSASDEPSPSLPMDDWSLVRLPDGRAGWVLTRMLVMAIPDEVAQYAEGHRITSYFSLGEVNDRGEVKHHWLWTTIATGLQPYEFDSFRVFVWSLRRHRYETAYIERNLVGYFPVEVHPPQADAAFPNFSLIIRDKSGELFRRTYAFRGYRVRMIEKTPWNPPVEKKKEKPAPADTAATKPSDGSFTHRLRQIWTDWRKRLFGH
jgi:hypothetical protein